MKYSRTHIAKFIEDRLRQEKNQLQKQYAKSKEKIGFFYLDNLLPKELAQEIHDKFPTMDEAVMKKSLREYKYVAYQMDAYDPILEEIVYAFQDEKIVRVISDICDLKSICPDEHLYAGGLSLMCKNNYLNPHLDNSHDKDRKNKRVLNLLYYVTPNWRTSYGGNLEIWPDGLKAKPLIITSEFNRLVVMETHEKSWHSVEKVTFDGIRCCVSNYYFSDTDKMLSTNDFHVTTFRGRPSQQFRNIILRIDSSLRSNIRKIFKKGIKENKHQYQKKNPKD